MGTPLPQHGNLTTYNMENVLRSNIVNSEYFRDTCGKLVSWEEVVDEIYYSVSDVEPWMSGNARGASTAFCLLYRSGHGRRLSPMSSSCDFSGVVPCSPCLSLSIFVCFSFVSLHCEPSLTSSSTGTCRLFLLKPTEEEVQRMLDHEDSPYIRAVRKLF
jgi:PRP38 family